MDNSFHQKNEDKNTGSVKASAPMRANICVNCCDPNLKKTARDARKWLEDRDVGCHGTIQGGI